MIITMNEIIESIETDKKDKDTERNRDKERERETDRERDREENLTTVSPIS